MMDYMLAIGTCLTAVYTYSYGKWLRTAGNLVGSIGVMLLAATGVILAFYKVLSK